MNFQQQNDCQPRKSLAVPIFLERKGLQQRCIKLTWLLPADNVDDGHKHQDTSVSATTYADLARNIGLGLGLAHCGLGLGLGFVIMVGLLHVLIWQEALQTMMAFKEQ